MTVQLFRQYTDLHHSYILSYRSLRVILKHSQGLTLCAVEDRLTGVLQGYERMRV